jgi:preprotein translocase subunit SecF
VGPKVGNELKWAAIISIALSLLAQIIYIWFRFQFRFGVAAVIPLFHDVIITLGIFVALGLEMNLSIIAAFLTLIGYSINDTIVVFDRVRENLAKDQRSRVMDIIDRSINETLGRTVITGGTTLLALFALYFLGVGLLKDFALTMIVGIIFGTYSSVGVACSILASWTPEALRKTRLKTA